MNNSVGPSSGSPKTPTTIFSGLIVITAVLFNSVLAFVNAHVTTLSSAEVIAAELFIVGSASLIILCNGKREFIPWLILCCLIVTAALLIGFVSERFWPKYIRDVIIIPIFVMLGMAYGARSLTPILITIHSFVAGFAMYEAISPTSFGWLFNVASYYRNTRGMKLDLWHEEDTLFLSSVRPDERFILPSLDLHRLSSIFLEPVSLGNYLILSTILIVVLWPTLSWRTRTFLCIANVLILIGSDSRLGVTVCALVIAIGVFIRVVPRYLHVAYLPGTIVLAWILTVALSLSPKTDDFPGRIAKSIELLRSLDLTALLGAQAANSGIFADSGISYFIVTQTIFGVAVIWLFACLCLPPNSDANKRFLNGMALYISLNLLVSFSLFSIKTAALLWFSYGVLYMQSKRRAAASLRPLQWTAAGQRTVSGETRDDPQAIGAAGTVPRRHFRPR